MKRTQLYLDEESARILSAESRQRRTTISALIREAVAVTYGGRERADRRAIIERLAGVWADRDEVADTGALVRQLRASKRPARWARGGGRGKVSPRH